MDYYRRPYDYTYGSLGSTASAPPPPGFIDAPPLPPPPPSVYPAMQPNYSVTTPNPYSQYGSIQPQQPTNYYPNAYNYGQNSSYSNATNYYPSMYSTPSTSFPNRQNPYSNTFHSESYADRRFDFFSDPYNRRNYSYDSRRRYYDDDDDDDDDRDSYYYRRRRSDYRYDDRYDNRYDNSRRSHRSRKYDRYRYLSTDSGTDSDFY